MSTGQTITDKGRLISLDRTFIANPTRSAPSQFKVGTGTTTPNVIDTDVETVVAINGGNLKNLQSGFPSLDITNIQATIRAFLDTTEANGNTLSEWGTFNSDGTPLMFSHSVHTGISKTNVIEITYIEKDKII